MHIAIAGNIGSGKTTLAGLLARHLNFEVEYEVPTENPYIRDFYGEMPRWAFNMQVFFLTNRLQQTLDIQQSGNNTVQDRSIYEDAEIFVPNLVEMGSLDPRDYETYKSLYDAVIKLVEPPKLIIYLRASIATLVDHIAERGRDYEENLRIDYLRKLNDKYEDWYERYDLGKKIEVDVDQVKFLENPADMGVILNRVNAELFGLFKTEADNSLFQDA